MSGNRPYVSWSTGQTTLPPTGRDRRRSWLGQWSVGLLVLVPSLVVGDLAVLFIVGFITVGPGRILGAARTGTLGPCSTAWADRADQLLASLWTVVALLVVAIGVACWRKAQVLPVAITQAALAAVLLPLLSSAHAHAAHEAQAVAHHQQTVSPDSGPLATCNPKD